MKKISLALLLTTGVIGALVPAIAHADVLWPTRLYNCSTPVTTPKQIVINCADANRYVAGLHWQHWGAQSATATGRLYWNNCQPNCAAGHEESRAITFTANGRRLVKGKNVFLYTNLHGPAGSWGTAGTNWSLPTSAL